MDLITFLATVLGPTFFSVFGELLKKAVMDIAVESGARPLKDWIDAGYDERQDNEHLRDALLATLDQLTGQGGLDQYEKFVMALRLTDLDEPTRRMLAAAAVEMVDYRPYDLPQELFGALQLGEDKRELLARFLFMLRNRLKDTDRYRHGIAYANWLDDHDRLKGLTRDMISLGEKMETLLTIERAMIQERRLELKDEDAFRRYLEELRKIVGEVTIPLARRRAPDEPAAVPIRQVYVPLTVKEPAALPAALRKEPGQRRKATGAGEEQERAPGDHPSSKGWGEILGSYPRLALLGKPGTGKTTLLRKAALACADGHTGRELGWEVKAPLFPIFIRLRSFGEYLKKLHTPYDCSTHGPLLAYLDDHYRNQRRLLLTADFFEKRLGEGNCLVLFDGLDEVTTLRGQVAQCAAAFVRHFQVGNHFVLSSRPPGYESVEGYLRPAGLVVCEVDVLPPEGIRKLIDNLFWINESDPTRQAENSQRLANKILGSANLVVLASNPLFCTTLVEVSRFHGAQLPEKRVDILQEVTSLLLGHWKAQEQGVTNADELAQVDVTGRPFPTVEAAVETREKRLRGVAFSMQENHQTEIRGETAVSLIQQSLLDERRTSDAGQALEWAEAFLYESENQSGLLVDDGTQVYSFWHAMFREYLAARSLMNLREAPFIAAIKEYTRDDWWQEVILLAAAHYNLPGALRDYLVQELLVHADRQRAGEAQGDRFRTLLMAAWCARDMGERLSGVQHFAVHEALKPVMWDRKLSLKLRVQAADALDGMGWLPEKLSTFAPIGRSPSTGREAHLGRYPVTNAQYARFLQPENFRDPWLWCGFPRYDAQGGLIPESRWKKEWGDEGWQWLQARLRDPSVAPQGTVVYPRYWFDPDYGSARPGAPVVGVTWYEANAYCRWLQRAWAQVEEGRENDFTPAELRLPTEKEWEQAAGGVKEKDRYPWDAEGQATADRAEILARSNVAGEIGRTTPVGMYQDGQSQLKIWDLAGNVWEWQANYSNRDQVWLALRGGGWDLNIEDARVAARLNYRPYDGWVSLGFRVVAFPS